MTSSALPPLVLAESGIRLLTEEPVGCQAFDAGSGRVVSGRLGYQQVDEVGPGRWIAVATWRPDGLPPGLALRVEDTWTLSGANHLRVDRRLVGTGGAGTSGAGTGVTVCLRLGLRLPDGSDAVRFCAPAMVYSPAQHAEPARYVFSDSRLSYPSVTLWEPTSRWAVSLQRVSVATFDSHPDRVPGQRDFLQRTDIGSVGFDTTGEDPALVAFWPWSEVDRSAMLDAKGTPATAYHLVGDRLEAQVSYEILCNEADTFGDAVLAAYAAAVERMRPEPAQLSFSLEESIELRARSMAKTYTEWGTCGAGFLLNFDPDRGYDAQAKAFGASFTDHAMGSSRGILEYGFTGRQLDVAAVLAARFGGAWLERAAKVADFFVDTLATPSGWVHPLYSLTAARPLFSCGDPGGPVMHYLGTSPAPGAYLRMMTEAVSDLLTCYQLFCERGDGRERWLETCRSFGDFLVRVQESDGGWYRAYTPDGEPLRSGEWFGGSPPDGKASTAAPVPFLLALAAELGGDDAAPLVAAAERAAAYVVAEQVEHDDYRGGTLDNPNVVDKEAALLAMKALLHLHSATGAAGWLGAAERAAKLAITWHSMWDVPLLPDTRVGRARVRSTGWGGINSTWGAGVTDIYSLLFLAELVTLSRRTGNQLYARVAELAAYGCQQILAHPVERFGFADDGMQPEGISFCDQGVDEGLIAKGDTWGGLGWIYTAGTSGLTAYLDALRGQEAHGVRRTPG